MDEDNVAGTGIAREDILDAIEENDTEGALRLLTEYYDELCGKNATPVMKIRQVLRCAKILFDAKRYEETTMWLDQIGTTISDTEGPDSETYALFIEDEDIEALRMKATEKAIGEDEEVDDDLFDEDE